MCIRDRRVIMVRIHALIDSHDLPAKKDQFSRPDWRAEMKTKLRDDEWLVLEMQLSQYDHALSVIDLLDERMIALASKSPYYQPLLSIPGVGPVRGLCRPRAARAIVGWQDTLRPDHQGWAQ